jgi:DNA repair/transcription protein MET18/MMS19
MMDLGAIDKTDVGVFVKAFVEADDDSDARRDSLNKAILKVSRGNITFGDMVATMGEFLTNDEKDGKIRSRAVLLLAEVLVRMPKLQFKAGTMAFFVTFFCDRFEDFPSAPSCLKAIDAILQHHKKAIVPENILTIFRAIFQKVHVPSLSQALRQQAFTLLEKMFDDVSFVAAIKPVGAEYAEGFIQAMEGEKDPRCLLKCLRVAGLTMKSFGPFSNELTEELFDVTACYFPISFKPPPNDPYGIRPNDLVEALRAIFTSSPEMAPHLLPLLLEKLASTMVAVKIDSFVTLKACARAWGVTVLVKGPEGHMQRMPIKGVCDAIHREVTVGQEREVTKEALSVAMEIARLTSVQLLSSGEGEGWQLFTMALVQKAVGELKSARSIDSLLSRGADTLLQALARSSALVFEKVLELVVPILIERFNAARDKRLGDAAKAAKACEGEGEGGGCCGGGDHDHDHDHHQSPGGSEAEEAALSMLCGLAAAVDPHVDFTQSTRGTPIAPFVKDFLAIFEVAASEDSGGVRCQCLGNQGARHLLVRPPAPLLSEDEQRRCIERWTNLLGGGEQTDSGMEVDEGEGAGGGSSDEASELQRECLDALVAAGIKKMKTNPSIPLLLSITLPSLMSSLGKETGGTGSALVLEAICSLCAIPQVFEVAVPMLLQLAVNEDGSRPSDTGDTMVDVGAPKPENLLHFACVCAQAVDGGASRAQWETQVKVLEAVAQVLVLNQAHVKCMDQCVTQPLGAVLPLVPLVLQALLDTSEAIGNMEALADASIASDRFDALLTPCVDIVRTVAQHVSAPVQEQLLQMVFRHFGPANATPGSPLHPQAPATRQSLVFFFTAVIGSMKRELLQPPVAPLAEEGGAQPPTPPALVSAAELGSVVDTLITLVLDGRVGGGARGAASVRRRNILGASQCIAAIVNKLGAKDEALGAILSQAVHARLLPAVTKSCSSGGGSSSTGDVTMDDEEKVQQLTTAIDCVVWIAKALVLRNHPQARTLVGFLVQLMVDQAGELKDGPSPRASAAARAVAMGLRTIATDGNDVHTSTAPPDTVLTRACSSNIALFHTQRFFAQVFPLVTGAIKDLPAGVAVRSAKHPLLLALVQLLASDDDTAGGGRGVPTSVWTSNAADIKLVVPPLLQALELPVDDPDLKLAALGTFKLLLGLCSVDKSGAAAGGSGAESSVDDELSVHIPTGIPLMLRLSCFKTRAKVRMVALECLLLFLERFPYVRTFPFKKEVVRELLKPLDDRKRAVRKKAVLVRNKWSVLTNSRS